MFNWPNRAKKSTVASFFRASHGAVRAAVGVPQAGRLKIASFEESPLGWDGISIAALRSDGVILLPPETYASSLIQTPSLGAGANDEKMTEALRWSFAKDADIDMALAKIDILHVRGVDEGGALLKDSHWVFAIEQARLERVLLEGKKSKARICAVDVLATAQRNLCWSEARSTQDRPGCYASLVIGAEYSGIGLISLDGDLLFHKQMEWSAASLTQPDARERLVVDLQRNLGYFERRLASFAVHKGFVYGMAAGEIAAHLTTNLGTFDWVAGAMPEVDLSLLAEPVSGDQAWLIGAMMRWL